MSNIKLNAKGEIDWIKISCKGAVSISQGDLRIHRSGKGSYTASRVNPFVNCGIAKSADEAKELCRESKK